MSPNTPREGRLRAFAPLEGRYRAQRGLSGPVRPERRGKEVGGHVRLVHMVPEARPSSRQPARPPAPGALHRAAAMGGIAPRNAKMIQH